MIRHNHPLAWKRQEGKKISNRFLLQNPKHTQNPKWAKTQRKKKQEQRYSYDPFLQEAHRILLNTPPSSSAQTYPPNSNLPSSRLIVVRRRHLDRFFPKPVEKKKTETEISRPNFWDLKPKTRNTKNPQENHRSSLSLSLCVSLSSVLRLASECLLLPSLSHSSHSPLATAV